MFGEVQIFLYHGQQRCDRKPGKIGDKERPPERWVGRLVCYLDENDYLHIHSYSFVSDLPITVKGSHVRS